MSKKNGWEFYYSDMMIGDNQFTWNGIAYTISVNQQEAYFEISIDNNPRGTGYPVVLKYDREPKTLNSKGYDNIQEESGHPK